MCRFNGPPFADAGVLAFNPTDQANKSEVMEPQQTNMKGWMGRLKRVGHLVCTKVLLPKSTLLFLNLLFKTGARCTPALQGMHLVSALGSGHEWSGVARSENNSAKFLETFTIELLGL